MPDIGEPIEVVVGREALSVKNTLDQVVNKLTDAGLSGLPASRVDLLVPAPTQSASLYYGIGLFIEGLENDMGREKIEHVVKAARRLRKFNNDRKETDNGTRSDTDKGG